MSRKRESTKFKRAARVRRHRRVRRRVHGTQACPRLSVFRSHRHVFAQLIDDEGGTTLVAASSLALEGSPPEGIPRKVAVAKMVGQALARSAVEKGIERAVFDRSGYRYHGRIAALAEGAREGGLKL